MTNEIKQQKNYRVGMITQAKLLGNAIYEEVFDSIYGGFTFMDKLREVIPTYRWDVRTQMRNNAAKVPSAKYTFEDKYCHFENKDDAQIILELPTKKEEGYLPSLKYIVATNAEGKKVVAAIYGFGMHRNIVAEVEKITQSKLSQVRGGWFNVTKTPFRKPTLEIHGRSQDFGAADHEEVASMLNKCGLEARVMK